MGLGAPATGVAGGLPPALRRRDLQLGRAPRWVGRYVDLDGELLVLLVTVPSTDFGVLFSRGGARAAAGPVARRGRVGEVRGGRHRLAQVPGAGPGLPSADRRGRAPPATTGTLEVTAVAAGRALGFACAAENHTHRGQSGPSAFR